MPDVTFTVTAAQATRILAALRATDYPASLAGYKQFLADHTRNLVRDYEKAAAIKAALQTVQEPAEITII